MTLSTMQLELLQILDRHAPHSLTGAEILNIAGVTITIKTANRIHDAAGTMSRRGLIVKHNPVLGRGMAYSITVQGKAVLTKKANQHSKIKKK